MIEKMVVFILGSVVGSFLNVCIHRMPLGESVVWPSSHCPHCRKRIPAYDNIPFLSFILLRGRCRFCKEKISWRYPLVELITASFFLIFYLRFGLTFEFIFYLVFLSGLIIATFVDIKHRIIPDEVSVGGLILGCMLSMVKAISLNPLSWNWQPLLNSLLGALIGGGTIYLTGLFFDFVYFKLLKRPPIQGETESIGGGDVKLLAMVGAFLGWKLALLTFFLAPLLGLTFGIFNMLLRKDHTIPYGPFISLSALISLFFGEGLLRYLLLL